MLPLSRLLLQGSTHKMNQLAVEATVLSPRALLEDRVNLRGNANEHLLVLVVPRHPVSHTAIPLH